MPEQVVVPGTHTPEHAPFAQAYGHALTVLHVPEAEHVSTPVAPLFGSVAQVVAFGAHTPWHDAPPPPGSTQA